MLEKFSGNEEHVVLPEGVTEIGFRAFRSYEKLKSVSIPDTITDIDRWTFYDGGKTLADESGFCRVGKFLVNYTGKSSTVVVPDGITKICARAMESNKTIQKLVLPASIEVIGNSALSECTHQKEVVFPDNCMGFRRIGDDAFKLCKNLQKINIPDSINEVASAFEECEKLFSPGDFKRVGCVLVKCTTKCSVVSVPDGIKVIAEYAFDRNEHISEVILPDSVEYIGKSAFSSCKNLRRIMMKGVKRIAENAFSSCENLKTVVFSDCLEAIANGAFHSCCKIKRIVLPKSLKKLGGGQRDCKEGVFCNTGITSIEIPEQVEIIDDFAFNGCEQLKEVFFKGTVKTIGICAFANCKSLKRVVFEDGVEKICKEAFMQCDILSDVVIPESIGEIERNAFLRCPELGNINLPDKLVKSGRNDYLVFLGIKYENGCIIRDGVLEEYVGEPGVVRVADGVVVCAANVFSHLFGRGVQIKTTQIILPDSVKEIRESEMDLQGKGAVDINMPSGYLRQTSRLPSKFTIALLSGPWKGKATLEDYASLFLFQSSKELKNWGIYVLNEQPDESVRAFTRLLTAHTKNAYVYAAEFVFNHKAKIKQETINDFYLSAVSAKASQAVDMLKSLVAINDSSKINKTEKRSDGSPKVQARAIEQFCQEQYLEYTLDQSLEKAGLSNNSFNKVLYKDSKDMAPAFIVKCAVVPYLDQMGDKQTIKYGFSAYFAKNADRVAAELDHDSFITALEEIANIEYGYLSPQRLIPLCRFGSGAHIKKLSTSVNKWLEYGRRAKGGVNVARGAILLNDSREAMLFADKNKLLRKYASMRNADEDSIRDNLLSDFGLDENGQASFDIGNTTIGQYPHIWTHAIELTCPY